MLYLVQHAEAKGAAEDPERDLSEAGIAHAKQAAAFLAAQGGRLDVVWHSPKLRAAHTARIIAESLGCGDKTFPRDHLLPTDDPGPVAREVEELADSDLMIVGHLPFLERFVALILGSAASPVRFHNAGIVALSNKDGSWAVEWLVIPGLFPKES